MHCSFKLKKINGKLEKASSIVRFNYFEKRLEDNQEVDVYMETINDNGTYPQLKKAHKMLRLMCEYTGYSIEEMKMIVKNYCGLAYKKTIDGEHYIIPLKSMGDMSKVELSNFIECISNYASVEMGIIIE